LISGRDGTDCSACKAERRSLNEREAELGGVSLCSSCAATVLVLARLYALGMSESRRKIIKAAAQLGIFADWSASVPLAMSAKRENKRATGTVALQS